MSKFGLIPTDYRAATVELFVGQTLEHSHSHCLLSASTRGDHVSTDHCPKPSLEGLRPPRLLMRPRSHAKRSSSLNLEHPTVICYLLPAHLAGLHGRS